MPSIARSKRTARSGRWSGAVPTGVGAALRCSVIAAVAGTWLSFCADAPWSFLGDRARGRQLAELGELERDRALQVMLVERGLFLRREKRRAQACVADVAAGQLVLAGEHVERQLAGARQLARQVAAPQL